MIWLVLALAGAIVCTSLDHLHVTHAVLVYRSPDVWSQAWWVPLEFAMAAVVAVATAMPLVRPRLVQPTVRVIAGDVIGFVGAYALTSFMPHELATLTLLVLVSAFLVRVLAERISPWLVLSCVGMAIGGVTCEGLLSKTGAFHYLHPDFFGTPRWLAGIYLHAGLLTGRLAMRVAEHERGRAPT